MRWYFGVGGWLERLGLSRSSSSGDRLRVGRIKLKSIFVNGGWVLRRFDFEEIF